MLTKFTGMESSRVINTLTNVEESNVSYAIKWTEGIRLKQKYLLIRQIKREYYYEKD